jgi:tetratricopeptide (TPR) repeat protein
LRVRPHLLAACLALAVAAPAIAPRAAHADFDPTGRSKKRPPKPGSGPAKPGSGPAKPGKPGKPKDEEEGRAARSPDATIAHYTPIALSAPSEPVPVARLVQAYRERDGNLKKLVDDFEKRAAAGGPDAWAAKVVLAGVYTTDGRYEDAVRTYQQAIAERPTVPWAMLALGQLQADRQDKAAARATLEGALPLLKNGADVEKTTRQLFSLSLDLKDYEGAKRYHEALVKAAGGSLYVKAELGRELLARGDYERAEAELREMVKASAGDNRALAPALRDLGAALAKEKKMDEAMATLKRALAVAGSAAGVRSQILAVMTDAYRAEGKLAELVAILEAEHPGDFQRLAMMGALYEETGDVDKAIATYRKALAVEGKQIDVRLKLVHLLQTAGELDQAIKEYEGLIKAAPNNPDFVFELCETLIQRGDRPKALRLLGELEARAHEDDVLAAVADFYERVEEKDRSLKVLQKLAASNGGDPAHVIDLGDRYYQAGDKKRALETWARIKVVVPNRAKAEATLGEVYLDHDMAVEALAALREAVQLEPSNVRYKKTLATALERAATSLGSPAMRYGEARAIWEELLAGPGGADKILAREARTHIVSLWALTRELPAQVTPLSTRFSGPKPDLEAGRLLAEVLRKLHRLPEAEAALRRVVELAPGDEESLLALERVLVQEQNLEGAIAVLQKLVDVDDKRAREFYQRMAEYAAQLYHDDDAIKFYVEAVKLSPNDATGHQKLGGMYKRRGDVPRAIAELRLAIAQNDRLFPVYFDLAELLLSTGQIDEADRLFRRVVRASADEELVARAARMSMQVNLGKGTLSELERELLPVAVGNPQKTIYRRLLVELYGAMTFPLVQKLKAEGPRAAGAAAARAELGRIGARAVKPLLDALADDKEAQQEIAIHVLAYVENRNAGPALYNYATGSADKALRVRAMIACGALRDPALLPRYEQMLAPKEGAATVLPSDAIAVAAAWGVARMGDKKAEPLLVRLLSSPAPDVRALAALGLGLGHDRKYAPALAALARSPEAGAIARAAATYGLAELGAGADPQIYLANAQSNEGPLREAALLAMARAAAKDDGGKARSPADAARVSPLDPSSETDAVASGVFSPDDGLRGAAVLAGAALATHAYHRSREALPVPDGALTLRDVLAGLGPDPYGPTDRAEALLALAPSLRKAAVAAVSTSPDRARAVADALLAGGARPSLLPLVDPAEKLDPKLEAPVNEAIESIAAAVVPGFVALVRHPSVDVRTRAVEVLARRPEAEAQAAVVDALDDPDEGVRRAALAAAGSVRAARPDGASDKLVAAVAHLVKESPSWPLRVRAAEALGRLGEGGGAGAKVVVDTLSAAARGDDYALVREAAARALAPVDPAAARPVLADLAAKDPEPRVREAATELLDHLPK